jgi:hypothetical protein
MYIIGATLFISNETPIMRVNINSSDEIKGVGFNFFDSHKRGFLQVDVGASQAS